MQRSLKERSPMRRLEPPAPDRSAIGAEEGTRTPTPLRVHGPEPCASANSATPAQTHSSALGWRRQQPQCTKDCCPVKLRMLISIPLSLCQYSPMADNRLQLRQM